MLKVRIIPTLLWKEVGLVKGVSFDSWRRVGPILPAIKVYNTRQVDELIVVDITAYTEMREPDYDTVEEFSQECFVPLTIGGGIRTINHVKRLLRAGADKVSINSSAYEQEDLIKESSRMFGKQCIVVSIDVKKKDDGKYECFSESGSKSTGLNPVYWAKIVESLGTGEILITSIDNDGTMAGYDLELIKLISSEVRIPVIASGGAGCYEDMYKAITYGGASAVAAACIFHFTEQTPLEAKHYLSERGIPVRK